MISTPMYHEGSRRLQDRYETRRLADRLVEVVRRYRLKAAQEMAGEIAKSGPLGVQAARETLNLELVPAFRAATEREMFQQQALRETNDFKEGVQAGFGRREPVYTAT